MFFTEMDGMNLVEILKLSILFKESKNLLIPKNCDDLNSKTTIKLKKIRIE